MIAIELNGGFIPTKLTTKQFAFVVRSNFEYGKNTV